MIKNTIYKQVGYDEFTNNRHFHNQETEIVQIVKGSGTFLMDGKAYPIIENTLFIIDADKLHCSSPTKPENYIRNKLIIDSEKLDTLLKACGSNINEWTGKCISLTQIKSQYIDQLFYKIFLSTSRYSNCVRLLQLLESCIELPEVTASSNSLLGSALNYISENICEQLTLDTIAEHLNVSKGYLCHYFKKNTDFTIKQYIMLQRIQFAKDKLLISNSSISEIAIDCGFNSFSHFSRVFKENAGMTPSEYKKSKSRTGILTVNRKDEGNA